MREFRPITTKVKTIALIVLSYSFLMAQDNVLEMDNLKYGQVHTAGFHLKSPATIHIEATGAGEDEELSRVKENFLDSHNLFAYAWILKSDTREMVWRMTIDNTEKAGGWSSFNRRFEGEVDLRAGDYEVYFSAIESFFYGKNGGFFSIEKLLKKLFEDEKELEDYARAWKVVISGVNETYSSYDVKKILRKRKQEAIVNLTDLEDYNRKQAGISVTEPVEINIYAIGEGHKGKMFDYGWIINAETRELVWEMKEEDTDYAGGAVKNRVFKNNLELDAGDYLVYYRTDDSHSNEDWNSNPPYDPFYYGLTVWPADKRYDRSIIKKYSESKIEPVVSITHVGDYAYEKEGLKVTEPVKIRIIAMGEGRSGDMFDYGWITEAESGRTVWKMRYSESHHAGGASKNRLFDGVIKLDKGLYIVHYQSDDSHSYEDWNEHPPQDQEKWGISIFPVKNKSAIQRISPDKIYGKEIIAELIRVGDDEHLRKSFTLQERTRVRIYAIGEGDRDDMYDYGWIEDRESGETVWEMTYRKSDHAGGASKNRLVDHITTLNPGRYRLHYRTDGSHSFDDWNLTPPQNRDRWGITIYLLDRQTQ